MAKAKNNKMVIAGLDGGGLFNSAMKWQRIGIPERMEEIRHAVVECFSRKQCNPCNNIETGLIRPKKWDIGKINTN